MMSAFSLILMCLLIKALYLVIKKEIFCFSKSVEWALVRECHCSGNTNNLNWPVCNALNQIFTGTIYHPPHVIWLMQGYGVIKRDRACTLIDLGTLPSGRKILGIRINNGNPEGKPKFLYSSTSNSKVWLYLSSASCMAVITALTRS